MSGITLLVMWFYIIYRRRFIHGKKHFPQKFMIIVTLRYLFTPLIYGIALALGAANFWVAVFITLLVPILAVLAAVKLDIFKIIVTLMFCIIERRVQSFDLSTGSSKTTTPMEEFANPRISFDIPRSVNSLIVTNPAKLEKNNESDLHKLPDIITQNLQHVNHNVPQETTPTPRSSLDYPRSQLFADKNDEVRN